MIVVKIIIIVYAYIPLESKCHANIYDKLHELTLRRSTKFIFDGVLIILLNALELIHGVCRIYLHDT